MNVTGVYAFSDPNTWCTPNSILNEFESRGHKVHRVSLYDHKSRYDATELIDFVHTQDLYEPDIILFFDYGRFDSEWLDKKHFPNSFFVGEMGDEGQNFDNNFTKSHKFDLIHTPDRMCYLKYKEAGRNVIWLPHFTDTRIFYPMDQPVGCDVVSSRGRGGSQFLDYIENVMGGRFRNRNGFVGEEHANFLRSGMVVLQNSRHKEWTRRIPEAMSLGKLVITDRLPIGTRIENYYIDGEDIVYYDGVADCISKLNYYTSKEGSADRERIAANGYEKTTSFHTQVQRVNSIINQYSI